MPPLPALICPGNGALGGQVVTMSCRAGLNYQERRLIVSMYADDMVVYMRHPACNTNPFIRELIHFGGLLGVVINWTKSYIFLLTAATGQF